MPVANDSGPPVFDYGAVVQALEDSVQRNLTDGLLLSGGLDTAMLAYLMVRWVKPDCVTVALSGAPAPDVEYARLVASRLGLRHYVHYFGDDELDEGIRATVRIMQTFDPMEVRNSAAIYVALKQGRDRGLRAFMTGDGCDELFGGYSFLFGLTKEQLDVALEKMWTNMSFSSTYIARELGVTAVLPFLDPQFMLWAKGLDSGLKIKSEGRRVWGKWLLRQAFEDIMPPEIVWRDKAPIEVGTGTTTLPALFDARIADVEFEEKKKKYLNEDRVVIRNKEHLVYYEIYRSTFGVPGAVDSKARVCPGCGSSVDGEISFCRTCGAYPV